MATKNTAAAEPDADTDGPLIDLNEADVKKLIARGKKRGYLTYDELNAALPQDEMSSEQIEDIMSAISAGVPVQQMPRASCSSKVSSLRCAIIAA